MQSQENIEHLRQITGIAETEEALIESRELGRYATLQYIDRQIYGQLQKNKVYKHQEIDTTIIKNFKDYGRK